MTPPDTTTGNQSGGTGRRVDTLTELGFSAEIQGRQIGKFAECTGLAVEYDMLEYAEGGNNMYVHRLRGHARYPNVVLKRGVTFEDELMRWFFAIEKPSERPVLTISILDEMGKRIRHWALAAAQPIRWSGPNGAAGGGAATESLEVGHDGFV